MIKMCDLPRYADADMEEIKKMKEAHTVLNQVTYERPHNAEDHTF